LFFISKQRFHALQYAAKIFIAAILKVSMNDESTVRMIWQLDAVITKIVIRTTQAAWLFKSRPAEMNW